jgi:hypothetical protein
VLHRLSDRLHLALTLKVVSQGTDLSGEVLVPPQLPRRPTLSLSVHIACSVQIVSHAREKATRSKTVTRASRPSRRDRPSRRSGAEGLALEEEGFDHLVTEALQKGAEVIGVADQVAATAARQSRR